MKFCSALKRRWGFNRQRLLLLSRKRLFLALSRNHNDIIVVVFLLSEQQLFVNRSGNMNASSVGGWGDVETVAVPLGSIVESSDEPTE